MASVVKMLALFLMILEMVPDTMQLSVDHPLHTFVERLNINSGPFLGLIVSDSRYEKSLKNSSYFEAGTSTPYITVAGRRFNFGKFNGVPVVYVLAGEPLANVAVTVQILLDTFRISGIIGYGAAGTVSNKIFIGDVVVPSQAGYTGVWSWKAYESDLDATPALKFGDYNVPNSGENYLQHIEFSKTQHYTPTSSKKANWINVHPEWVQQASQLNFDERPTVHIGQHRASSADIYLSNEAYGNFLNKQLNVTVVDTETAAIVSTARANGVPHIVFRGASNRPGSSSDSRLSEVTARNVLKTVAMFIDSLFPKANANAAY